MALGVHHYYELMAYNQSLVGAVYRAVSLRSAVVDPAAQPLEPS